MLESQGSQTGGQKAMWKSWKMPIVLVASTGLSLCLLGATLLVANRGLQRLTPESQPRVSWVDDEAAQPSSAIGALLNFPPEQRAEALKRLAQGPASVDRQRARYLLASDLLQQRQGQQALEWLQGLEKEYPLLAAQIQLKRAQAYEAMGNKAAAQQAWMELLKQYPQNPVAAEARFVLGQRDASHWNQLLVDFPAHPRTIEIVRMRLRQNPKQPQLLLHLARYASSAPSLLKPAELVAGLDRLVSESAKQLKPADWEAIAFAYWENQEYGKAGAAYRLAPRTARTAYRAARGLHLGERGTEAYGLYQAMVRDFPNAPETPTALFRLAKLAPTPQESVAYLEQIVQRFPDRAAEAIGEQSKLMETGAPQTAAQLRERILTRYSASEAAAELRWQQAQKRAAARDLTGAWKAAATIMTENPQSEIGAEAGFWAGKWANRLGKTQEARAAFEHVLKFYPETYFAWRSAALLGLPVGDFTSVRQLKIPVTAISARSTLPAGSPALKELYQLGQDQDAWTLWQVEFRNLYQPTVAEQFTDGVMRLGVGDSLNGIFMASHLAEREIPAEREQYRELKRQRAYWQALYPFLYGDLILSWSEQRQLNPLLVTALIRQESRFEPKIRSVVGATGLMQVMPETGEWIAEKLGEAPKSAPGTKAAPDKSKKPSFNLENPNDNIKLGTWYLDYTHREYRDHSLLAVASYNAGPGAVEEWVTKYGLQDPDEFVRLIPYEETRGYVKSVFGNYWNYLRLYNPEIRSLLSGHPSVHP